MDYTDELEVTGSNALKQLTSPYRGKFILSGLLISLEWAAILMMPWFAAKFSDGLLGHAIPFQLSIRELLVAWTAAIVLMCVFRFAGSYLTGNATEQLLSKLRSRLFDHLQSLPMRFFHGRNPGDSLSLLTADASLYSQYLSTTMVMAVPMILAVLVIIGLMLFLDPYISLVAGLYVLSLQLIIKAMNRTLFGLDEQLSDMEARTFSLVEENLSLLPEIKSSTNENVAAGQFREGNLRLMDLKRRRLKRRTLLTPLVLFMGVAGIIILLSLGTNSVEKGMLSFGQLISLIMLVFLLNRPITFLLGLQQEHQMATQSRDRLVKVFSTMPEPTDSGTTELRSVRGKIEFKSVSYGFHGVDEVLDGVDIRIKPGETVAISGHAGSGKTTFTHLLMRFLQPSEGQILIDGQDIAEIKLTSLRSRIGLVKQDVLIIDGSIADNILFGYSGAGLDEIRAAAKAAHALDFILKLPQGFDTLIGEKGIKLSAGQRQRLSLARALLKNPPILILDEASAMFDQKSEQTFLKECHQAIYSRTVILISNRPGSLSLADKVYQLSDGKLVEVNPLKMQQYKGTYGPG
ncbi:MAG: ABC transporter ATP-binding protein [bacterium]